MFPHLNRRHSIPAKGKPESLRVTPQTTSGSAAVSSDVDEVGDERRQSPSVNARLQAAKLILTLS